jgi:acyl-CoA dehydrogenase
MTVTIAPEAIEGDHRAALAEAVDEVVRRYASAPWRELWDALEEAGFTLLSIPEEAGGSGGELPDLAVVLERCAYAGARLPLVGTVVAAWAATRAGIAVPAGPMACAWPGDGARSPWAPVVDHVVGLTGTGVRIGTPAEFGVRPVEDSLTGEPVGTVEPVELVEPQSDGGAPTPAEARLRAALLRSVELRGAATRALDAAARYSTEREQFGRPINRFQAVGQLLAQCAGEVVTTGVVVDAAIAAAADPGTRADIAAMVAKIQASATAGRVAAIAHQVHGAIGFTEEHPLHVSTRALWSWRDDYGDEHHWARRLATLAEHHGPHLWHLLAD